jgi:hypothetical protein
VAEGGSEEAASAELLRERKCPVSNRAVFGGTWALLLLAHGMAWHGIFAALAGYGRLAARRRSGRARSAARARADTPAMTPSARSPRQGDPTRPRSLQRGSFLLSAEGSGWVGGWGRFALLM